MKALKLQTPIKGTFGLSTLPLRPHRNRWQSHPRTVIYWWCTNARHIVTLIGRFLGRLGLHLRTYLLVMAAKIPQSTAISLERWKSKVGFKLALTNDDNCIDHVI